MIKFWKSAGKVICNESLSSYCNAVETTCCITNSFLSILAKGKTGCPVRPPEFKSVSTPDIKSLINAQILFDEHEGKYNTLTLQLTEARKCS